LAVIFYGVVIEPRLLLDVRETRAKVPNAQGAWDGAQVAVLGDQQTGMWLDNEGMVEKAVEEVVQMEPDLILLTGDFLYGEKPESLARAVDMARPLADSGIPTYAVLGNHDYSMQKPDGKPDVERAGRLERQLESIGIEVLENESVALSKGAETLHLVGVGSHWAGRDRPEKALEDVPPEAPRLVLTHNPVSWRVLPPHTAPASFAGHTHGGQLRIPFTDSHNWLDIAKQREVVADGWVRDESVRPSGNWIYVNRGIGFSNIPMRLLCNPELTVVTLDSSLERPPE
jgi:hypothetical protein